MFNASRQRLNQRLRQNWIEMIQKRNADDEMHVVTSSSLSLSLSSSSSSNDGVFDSDLTNLSWLVGLDLEGGLAADSSNGSGPMDGGSGIKEPEEGAWKWERRPQKPTHTYSAMITMAINETPDKQITVAGIYSWFSKNFSYYGHTSVRWKNSVRHCLSTNRRFQRVPQSRDRSGKRFWRIVPDVSSTKSPRNSSFRRPLANRRPNDGGIQQAIRVIGRCETIEATADDDDDDDDDSPRRSESPPMESIVEFVDESYDGSSRTDPSSGSGLGSTGLPSPRWSSDSRLNDILSDLDSIPTLDAASSDSDVIEKMSDNVTSRRLVNNDFLFSGVTTCHDEWILTDISRSSCGRSLAEYLRSVGQEDFHSELTDSEMNLLKVLPLEF